MSERLPAEREAAWQLQHTRGRLELRELPARRARALYVDFGSARLRRRCREGRRSLLGRAFGLHRGEQPAILDATAGFGADAFVLAALGCRVQLLERQSLVAALLEDGLRRARAAGGREAEAARRMELQCCEAREFLCADAAPDFDAVYLDPMFPGDSGSALNKKEMRILHALAGADTDAPDLLAPARRRARHRVVVKRRRRAPPLADAPPHHSLQGAAVRFDVYLRTRADAP